MTQANRPFPCARSECGLTLIEQLMIMFVLALLVRVALPSYQVYTKRPIINAAQQDLIRMAAALQANSFEKSLSLPNTSGYVLVPALPASRTLGTQASDFAGWQPTQGAKFNYSASSSSNATLLAFTVRASSTQAGILPTSCAMDLRWSAASGAYARTASAGCGFTSW